VQSLISLNGDTMRTMVNPQADLASEPRSIWPAWWIQPIPGETAMLSERERNSPVGNR
jgi:hypothetical protein